MLLLEKRINKMHTSFVVPTHQLTADKLKDMRKVQIALTRNPQCLLANHKLKTDRNSLSLTVSSGKIGVASLSFITRKQKKSSIFTATVLKPARHKFMLKRHVS